MESLTTDNSVSDVHHTKIEISGVQSRLNSQFFFLYLRRSDGAHAVCNGNHTFFPNMTEVMIRTSQLRLMRSEGRMMLRKVCFYCVGSLFVSSIRWYGV